MGDFPWIRRTIATSLEFAAARAFGQFKASTQNAAAVNRNTLTAILRLNSQTYFGHAHGLSRTKLAMDPADVYRAIVPLSEYDEYVAAVDLISQGERNVLTADPVPYLFGSSGTTGQPKRIPATQRCRRLNVRYRLVHQKVLDMARLGAKPATRGICLINLSTNPQTYHRLPVLSASSAGMRSIAPLIPWLWSAPRVVHECADHATSMYLHALFGLANREASHVAAVYAPYLNRWVEAMRERAPELCHDLARGTVSADLRISDSLRTQLAKSMRKQPRRASEVRDALAAESDGIIPQLWPAMRHLTTITTGGFSVSLPRLRALGGELPIYSPFYGSSEAMVGISLSIEDSPDYVLACGAAYFEFIPLDQVDQTHPDTLSLDQLQIGDCYEIVITTFNGLYRYRLQDIVRITGFHGEAPRMRFLYRRGTVLNLAGEKVTEHHTAQAVNGMLRHLSVSAAALTDYSITSEVHKGTPRYCIYIELQGHMPHCAPDAHSWAKILEGSLTVANQLYWSLGRKPGRIGPLRLCFVRPDTFLTLEGLSGISSSSGAVNQLKTPRVLWHPSQAAAVEAGVMIDGVADG